MVSGLKLSLALLVRLPSVFECYYGLILCTFEAEKIHMGQTAVAKPLVFVLVLFVIPAPDDVSLISTAGFCIIANGLGALVPTPDRLTRWIDNLHFFPIGCKTLLDTVMGNVAFRHYKEVYCSCMDP